MLLPEIDRRFALRIYIIILIFSILWTVLLFLPPLLFSPGSFSEGAAEVIYRIYSPLCHQEESRSFLIGGIPMAVCSRCTMIYAGFAAGVAAYPFIRRPGNINPPPLYLLAVPLALIISDAGLDKLGILKNTFVTRTITGFLSGFSLSFFVVPGFIRFFYEVTTFFGGKAGERT